jgi:hypothetical protein
MKIVKASGVADPEYVELLLLLAAAIHDTGAEDAAKSVEALKGQDPADVRLALSRIEQQPGLPTPAWTLIVRYKSWLDGKLARRLFVEDCRKASGLI